MQTIQPGQNTGVIIKPPSPDRLAKGVDLPTIQNENSDWREFECDGEWQKDMTIDWDSEACMTFAATNTLATYLNYLIKTNQILPEQMSFLQTKGYIGGDGKVALSPRFNAALNGTTINGNDFEAVWDQIESGGVVPDSVWPMPVAAMNADPANAWKLYYATPTEDVVALGKEFLTFFGIDSQWLVSDGNGSPDENFVQWLKTSPIHIATSVCPPWNTSDPIDGCGCGAQHGTQLSYVNPGNSKNILDHYTPFDKTLSASYCLAYAFQGWIVQIPQTAPETAPTTENTTTTTDPYTVVQNALPKIQTALNHVQNPTEENKPLVESLLSELLTDLENLLKGTSGSSTG